VRHAALALAAALIFAISTVAPAQTIDPSNMVSGVDSTSIDTGYQRTFYTVPPAQNLVLTDMATQVSSNWALLYDDAVLRSVMLRQFGGTGNTSCNVLSLTTGIVFRAGHQLTLQILDNQVVRFSWSDLVPAVVGIEPTAQPDQRPGFSLGPHPSGQTVELRFELAKPADVSLRIYDVAGRLVTTLADARLPAGRHDLSWTGKTASGEPAACSPIAISANRLLTEPALPALPGTVVSAAK